MNQKRGLNSNTDDDHLVKKHKKSNQEAIDLVSEDEDSEVEEDSGAREVSFSDSNYVRWCLEALEDGLSEHLTLWCKKNFKDINSFKNMDQRQAIFEVLCPDLDIQFQVDENLREFLFDNCSFLIKEMEENGDLCKVTQEEEDEQEQETHYHYFDVARDTWFRYLVQDKSFEVEVKKLHKCIVDILELLENK